MKHIYFVRHAQPDFKWKNDRSRPLTEAGHEDSKQVTQTLKNIPLDYAISSPYLRSMETIRECATDHGLSVITDDRLRERVAGHGGNTHDGIRKRWSDFDYHEEGGESIGMVQSRNVEAIQELLHNHQGESIIIGTHGTALSSILNYFDPTFQCDSFFRIIDFMPYIIRLDFEGIECVGKEELLIIKKDFVGI
jgi:Fructose-2,6-bisphosphatase